MCFHVFSSYRNKSDFLLQEGNNLTLLKKRKISLINEVTANILHTHTYSDYNQKVMYLIGKEKMMSFSKFTKKFIVYNAFLYSKTLQMAYFAIEKHYHLLRF